MFIVVVRMQTIHHRNYHSDKYWGYCGGVWGGTLLLSGLMIYSSALGAMFFIDNLYTLQFAMTLEQFLLTRDLEHVLKRFQEEKVL